LYVITLYDNRNYQSLLTLTDDTMTGYVF